MSGKLPINHNPAQMQTEDQEPFAKKLAVSLRMSHSFGLENHHDHFVVAQSLNETEPFVDADTAAAFVGITRRTLLQKVRAGKLPGHPLDPKAKKKDWRFKLSELDLCLRSTVNSGLQPPEPANRR